MKIKGFLFACTLLFAQTGLTQSTESNNPVPVETTTNGDKEVHQFQLSITEHPRAEVIEVMELYTKYLNYSVNVNDGQLTLKVGANRDKDNMLIMKRALIKMEINTLQVDNEQVSIDEFFSKYSLQR